MLIVPLRGLKALLLAVRVFDVKRSTAGAFVVSSAAVFWGEHCVTSQKMAVEETRAFVVPPFRVLN